MSVTKVTSVSNSTLTVSVEKHLLSSPGDSLRSIVIRSGFYGIPILVDLSHFIAELLDRPGYVPATMISIGGRPTTRNGLNKGWARWKVLIILQIQRHDVFPLNDLLPFNRGTVVQPRFFGFVRTFGSVGLIELLSKVARPALLQGVEGYLINI